MAFPVLARQDSPPTSPSDGDRYIVGASPTGSWASQAHKFAVWRSSFWSFRMPVEGETAYDQENDQFWFFDGTEWIEWELGGGGGGGGGPTSPLDGFLFIRSDVGIPSSRPGVSWLNETSGPNITTETVDSSFRWIILRQAVVSGGGPHFSARLWEHTPTGDKTITARYIYVGDDDASAVRRGGLIIGSSAASQALSLTYLCGRRLRVDAHNLPSLSSLGGFDRPTSYHPHITRYRFRIDAPNIFAEVNVCGVWQEFWSSGTIGWVSTVDRVGLFLQRQDNVDTTLYCDEFRVTT